MAGEAPAQAFSHLCTAFGKRFVHNEPRQLFMVTNNAGTGFGKNECLFRDRDGQLVFKMENNNGFFEKKVLKDKDGKILGTAKKFPMSMAKWTIKDSKGDTVAKTSTTAGMVKYGVEVRLPSRGNKLTFVAAPDLSLRSVNMWQENGKNDPTTPVMEAAYGSNVVMGLFSAAMQDWTYSILLAPGADPVLSCIILAIFTDLMTYNALGGMFGMN